MSKRFRKRFTSEEKIAILRLHHLESVAVPDLCHKHGIGPSMFYCWQKDFFENGSAALEHRARCAMDYKYLKIAVLQSKL
jgi:transposase-like protein